MKYYKILAIIIIAFLCGCTSKKEIDVVETAHVIEETELAIPEQNTISIDEVPITETVNTEVNIDVYEETQITDSMDENDNQYHEEPEINEDEMEAILDLPSDNKEASDITQQWSETVWAGGEVGL